MIRTFITAAAFATFAFAGAAQATTTTVQTRDLDLATAAGQARLDARLDRAARKVCSEANTGSLIRRTDQGCASKARASVEPQVAALRTVTRNGG